jgi:ABC-type cobalamin/Fe3+-siderophores transport system ATPase subunit
MTGFKSKKAAAQDKLTVDRAQVELALEALKEAQTNDDSMEKWDRNKKAITACEQALAQPEQEILLQYPKEAIDWEMEQQIKAQSLAQPAQERNFCSRCGKRTQDIHTCTPPDA